MIRIPKTPPGWMESLIEGGVEPLAFLSKTAHPELQKFVREANERYLHWDRLRYQKMPKGVSPQLAWAAVQISRSPQFQELPLSSFTGEKKLKYWLPPRHQEWVSIIDQQASGFIGGRHGQPIKQNDERYLFNSLMEEAIASSQLEGACVTREIGKELLRTGREPRDKAERMILNNYRAILEIRELKTDQLTPDLICHLQEVLTTETLEFPDAGGRFRRPDERIHIADAATGEEIYTPPPAISVAGRIKELCDFANSKSLPFMHPVAKAIALHFAIGFIHPFVDGNGRTARALFYWYMLKNGYWLFEFLPISRIIVAGPIKYSRAYLYTETDSGDLTYFIHYHLHVVIRAIEDLHRYLAAQQSQREEADRLLNAYPSLNHRQRSLISHLIQNINYSFTAQEYEGKYQVAYNTARSDLATLITIGLLAKKKRPEKGKGWVYGPAADLVKRLGKPNKRRTRADSNDENTRPT